MHACMQLAVNTGCGLVAARFIGSDPPPFPLYKVMRAPVLASEHIAVKGGEMQALRVRNPLWLPYSGSRIAQQG